MKTFNSTVDAFNRKYAIRNNGLNEFELSKTLNNDYYKCISELSEELLLFDKLTIKTSLNENISLAFLINQLGLKQVEALLDENAIEFIQWDLGVAFLVKNIPGVIPITSLAPAPGTNNDPEKTITLGLNFLKNPLDRKYKRAIIKKVSKVYKFPVSNLAQNSVNLIVDAYKSNKLINFGLKNENDITNLTENDKQILNRLADDILETTVLANLKCSSFNKYSYYSIASESFKSIEDAYKISDGFKEILKIEKLPSIKDLIVNKQINLKNIIELRHKKCSKEFRKWLEISTSFENVEDITREYIDAIVNKKGFFETNKGKFVRTVTISGLGTGAGIVLGGLLAGPPGMVAGGVASLGLSLMDTYLLEALSKGWNPKFFLEEYKNQISKPQ